MENAVVKLKRSSEATGDPEIWTPAQLTIFLAAAMNYEPPLVVGLTIKQTERLLKLVEREEPGAVSRRR